MTVVFIMLNLLMLISSYTTAYRFSAGAGFSEKLITTFLLYFSQITFTLLLLGLVLKNLSSVSIIILNSVISLSLLLVFTLKKYSRKALPDFYHHCRGSFSYLLKTKDVFLYILMSLFFFQVVLLLIKIYFLPPHVWDVFAYHLHPVVEWFQTGMIPASIDTPVIRLNRNPLGFKLLHFWIARFFGNITWIELPQFFYGLLTVLTSYALMLKMNVTKTSALKYALSIYFIPLILIESRTCQDHLALTGALLMSAFYFITVFFEKKGSYILFLGLSFGLVLGTKISGPHIIIVFFLALPLAKGFKLSFIFDFIKKNTRQLALGIIAVFALGGYWYFKDLSVLGSYLATISRLFRHKAGFIFLLILAILILLRWGFKKFHWSKAFKNKKVITVCIILIVIISGVALIKSAGLIKIFVRGQTSPKDLLTDSSFYAQYPLLKAVDSNFTRNILVFPFRIKDIGMYIPYTPDFLEQSGFGIQFFALGLMAYALMTVLIFKKKYRVGIPGFIFIFSMVLLGTYFFYYYTSANYRLFMFFPVFGLMLWAFLWEKLAPAKYYRRFIDLLLIGMVLFNISVTFFEGNTDKNRWKTLLTMDNPLDRTSIKYSPFFDSKKEDWIFIDNYIPPEEPIGYLAHIDSWIFPYFDYRMKRKIYHLRSLEGFRLVGWKRKIDRLEFNPIFRESLKQRGIHYIHINPLGARQLEKLLNRIIIDDTDVIRVTGNLYYFKW
jgi:hypothetical protein